MNGDHQREHHRDDLVLGQGVAVLARVDEPCHDVVSRIIATPLDQFADEVDDGLHLDRQLLQSVFGHPVHDEIHPVMKATPVGFGHTDHFADDGDRNREGVVLQYIDLLSNAEPIEQVVGDLLRAVGQAGNGLGGKRPADQLAQPHVLWIVHHDHAVRDHELQRLGNGQWFRTVHDASEPVVSGEVDAVAVAGQQIDVLITHVRHARAEDRRFAP